MLTLGAQGTISVFNHFTDLVNLTVFGISCTHFWTCVIKCNLISSQMKIIRLPIASVLQGQEIKCGDFAETTAFERYGVKTSEKANMQMSTGLARLGLARSAHRGRMKLLRRYVSKSSAALNPLTILLPLLCYVL